MRFVTIFDCGLHPADLPVVLAGPSGNWWSGIVGVLVLVLVGIVMTALMQSSTAAIAVTLSANYAGAVGLDQACALIIGQNIGTATSSALAAIGASNAAKRLALAYILFKLIAAIIALLVFPIVTPLLVRASSSVDAVTLLAGYHTAYNVVGVAVLLPLVDWFARVVERILPQRGSPLTQCLDPAALVTPIVAVEAVRRTIARVLASVCGSLAPVLAAASRRQQVVRVTAGRFDAAANEPPRKLRGSPDLPSSEQPAISLDDAFIRLEHCVKSLDELRSNHRSTTLKGVANGALTASEAIISVDIVRQLEALAHHAWRSAAHLLGRGTQNQ